MRLRWTALIVLGVLTILTSSCSSSAFAGGSMTHTAPASNTNKATSNAWERATACRVSCPPTTIRRKWCCA